MIPVVLFVYARPMPLARTLAALRGNRPPLLQVFSDAPASPAAGTAVAEVRRMIRGIDWCEVRLVERDANLGLGRSIMEGVSTALQEWESVLVCEDDLVMAPGTYGYLTQALHAYRDNARVMSVTGWTHPRITPPDVNGAPYLDGRAECLLWGTWRRAWDGMETGARELMNRCRTRGLDIYRYGTDLRFMAEREGSRNIWAVRFCFHHMLHGGLCVRPPRSMVEHIGWGADATSTKKIDMWADAPPADAPAPPPRWPEAIENPACAALHRRALGGHPLPSVPFLLHYYAGRAWRRLCYGRRV